MGEREATLRQVTDEIAAHEAVRDAFTAKSFTDLLVIVDVAGSEGVPEAVIERLAEHDLYGAEQVYGESEVPGDRSFAGAVGDGARHHFVDVRTRGSHQSYVVD